MRLLTVPEVAERLSLHPQTVRALIRNGRLKARNFGSNKRAAPRVTEDDLGVFMTETQFQPEGSVTH
jgi:excisionase family DNA binding protein